MLDIAVNIAQPQPPAYQLPFLNYKDKIFYIACTGNVQGSAASAQTSSRATPSQNRGM
jgi:hypothetical protein